MIEKILGNLVDYADEKAQQSMDRQVPATPDLAAMAQLASHADLEALVRKLALTTEALWQVVKVQSGLTEEQFLEIVFRLDESDGEIDGRNRRGPSVCRCGAKVNATASTCQYCGDTMAELPSPFAGLT